MFRDPRLSASIGLLLLIASCEAHRPRPPTSEMPVAPTQPQMLALLKAGDFFELDRRYEALQSAYEAHAISDEALRASFRAFYSTDPALASQYDAWVEHSSRIYVAHLARGIYYDFLGVERRGGESVEDTSAEQFRSMHEAFAIATAEFKRSLSLTRRPILTYLYWIKIDRYVGNQEEARTLFDRAIKIDPQSSIVREMYMMSLSTQWGGSQVAMRGLLDSSRQAGLSEAHLRVLQSAIVADRAWIELFQQNDYEAAAHDYLEAYSLDGEAGCLRCAAESFLQASDYSNAIDTYSRLLTIKPDDADAMHRQGWLYVWHSATPERGIADFQRAADLGNPQGNVDLARLYLTGKAVPYDRAHAISLLQPAAELGYMPARQLLDMVNENAFSNPSKNSDAQ
jgi:tetratricopeptide (TPR) repeat protein